MSLDVCFCFFYSLFLCSHSVHRNLSGMAIADITLLSGFEVEIEDLDKVSGSLWLRFFGNCDTMCLLCYKSHRVSTESAAADALTIFNSLLLAESKTWAIHFPLWGFSWKSADLLQSGWPDVLFMWIHHSFSSNSHYLSCRSSFSLRNASVLTHSRKYPSASYSLLQLSSMIIMSLVRPQFILAIFWQVQSLFLYTFLNFLQAYSALCSTQPPKEANLSPDCVQRMCASVQKVWHDF